MNRTGWIGDSQEIGGNQLGSAFGNRRIKKSPLMAGSFFDHLTDLLVVLVALLASLDVLFMSAAARAAGGALRIGSLFGRLIATVFARLARFAAFV